MSHTLGQGRWRFGSGWCTVCVCTPVSYIKSLTDNCMIRVACQYDLGGRKITAHLFHTSIDVVVQRFRWVVESRDEHATNSDPLELVHVAVRRVFPDGRLECGPYILGHAASSSARSVARYSTQSLTPMTLSECYTVTRDCDDSNIGIAAGEVSGEALDGVQHLQRLSGLDVASMCDVC